jgi:hypothetical protein
VRRFAAKLIFVLRDPKEHFMSHAISTHPVANGGQTRTSLIKDLNHVFGFFVNRFELRTWSALIIVGALTGVTSQIVDVDLLMPPVWAAHLVFGVGLVSFPWIAARTGGTRS